MVRKMEQVFSNLQTLSKLTFIAAITSRAKRDKYYHFYFVNEKLKT